MVFKSLEKVQVFWQLKVFVDVYKIMRNIPSLYWPISVCRRIQNCVENYKCFDYNKRSSTECIFGAKQYNLYYMYLSLHRSSTAITTSTTGRCYPWGRHLTLVPEAANGRRRRPPVGAPTFEIVWRCKIWGLRIILKKNLQKVPFLEDFY